MIYGEKIRRVINAKSLAELNEAKDFMFEIHGLTELNHQMLEMSQMAGVEAEDILIVRDIIHFSYEKINHLRTWMMYIYTFLYMLPFVLQLLIGGYAPNVTRILNGLSLATQLGILFKELNNLYNRPDKMEYFDAQNIQDLFTIFFSFFYFTMRIIKPEHVWLDVDAAVEHHTAQGSDGTHIEVSMPL
jgi:hypothetical protein